MSQQTKRAITCASSGFFFLLVPSTNGPPASLMAVCSRSSCWNTAVLSNGRDPDAAASASSGLLPPELEDENSEEGTAGAEGRFLPFRSTPAAAELEPPACSPPRSSWGRWRGAAGGRGGGEEEERREQQEEVERRARAAAPRRPLRVVEGRGRRLVGGVRAAVAVAAPRHRSCLRELIILAKKSSD